MSAVFDLTIVNIFCRSIEASRRATRDTLLHDSEVLGSLNCLPVRRLARWQLIDGRGGDAQTFGGAGPEFPTFFSGTG